MPEIKTAAPARSSSVQEAQQSGGSKPIEGVIAPNRSGWPGGHAGTTAEQSIM
jgi:hypothetical protein